MNTKTHSTEEQEQRALADWLNWNHVRWCHVPNGGKRDKITAAKLAGAGVKPGVPDILIFDRPKCAGVDCPADKLRLSHDIEHDPTKCRLRAPGVAIELKRAKPAPSKVSEEQAEWIDALFSRGWVTRVCYGASEAVTLLESLGYGRRG